MKKRRKRFYFYLILTFAIMITIFCFSNQNADESGEVSNAVLLWIVNRVLHNPQLANSGIGSFVIRKLAHFSIYLCLGASAALLVDEWKPKHCPFVWSWLIPIVYACTDEFHQYFVPGRSCELRDVCIDSTGALLGVIIIRLMLRVIHAWKTSGSQ
jgi:hypothetical protein